MNVDIWEIEGEAEGRMERERARVEVALIGGKARYFKTPSATDSWLEGMGFSHRSATETQQREYSSIL